MRHDKENIYNVIRNFYLLFVLFGAIPVTAVYLVDLLDSRSCLVSTIHHDSLRQALLRKF